jgi:hypothetical protein
MIDLYAASEPISPNAEIKSLIYDYPTDAANQLIRLRVLSDWKYPRQGENELSRWVSANPKQAAADLRRTYRLAQKNLPRLTLVEVQILVAAFRGSGLAPALFTGDYFASEVGGAAVYNGEVVSYLAHLRGSDYFEDLDVCEKPVDRIANTFLSMSLKEVAALAVALSRFFHAAKLTPAGNPNFGSYFNLIDA